MQFAELPGAEAITSNLLRQVASGRISHAQLITGKEGSYSLAFARAFASFILCEKKGPNDSCGQCPACHKSYRLIHPDLHFIYPTVSTQDHKSENATSMALMNEFRQAALGNPFLSNLDWLQSLEGDNKIAQIKVSDAEDIIRRISLQS